MLRHVDDGPNIVACSTHEGTRKRWRRTTILGQKKTKSRTSVIQAESDDEDVDDEFEAGGHEIHDCPTFGD
jgi:hypothetical protein